LLPNDALVNNIVIESRSDKKLLVAEAGFLRMLSTDLFSLSSPNNFYNETIYNVVIISNFDEETEEPILLLKISLGTQKNFSENYRKLGHAFSKDWPFLVQKFPIV
jgi:hypothetical protein